MVRHDMQKHRGFIESERLRIAQGLLTPSERQAKAKADEKAKAKADLEKTKGTPLFGEEP